ncbi:MAG: hypothetical protein GX424_00715 [Clostridiales bacterium]|nr:hypothetical protein [Clostridiales bacterium]
MANQAVETIREAERKAQEIEQQAAARADEILRCTRERASGLTEEASSRAEKYMQTKAEEERRQEEALIQLALQQAEQEIAGLRSLVKDRESQAVRMILKELIER